MKKISILGFVIIYLVSIKCVGDGRDNPRNPITSPLSSSQPTKLDSSNNNATQPANHSTNPIPQLPPNSLFVGGKTPLKEPLHAFPEYEQGVVIVKFKTQYEVNPSEIPQWLRELGVISMERVFPGAERHGVGAGHLKGIGKGHYIGKGKGHEKDFPDLSNIWILRLKEGSSALEASIKLSNSKNVEYAEPNFIFTLASLPPPPNDYYFYDPTNPPTYRSKKLGITYDASTQDVCIPAYVPPCTEFCSATKPCYCLYEGCSSTCFGSVVEDMWWLTRIQAPDAWDINTGSKNIIVAVADSGVDYAHPDLSANMWVNPIDGSHGYNFVANNNDPMDDTGHGTVVAGIIGSVGNNGIGTVGVNWNVRIMALKVTDKENRGVVSKLSRALYYAANNGTNVINHEYRTL